MDEFFRASIAFCALASVAACSGGDDKGGRADGTVTAYNGATPGTPFAAVLGSGGAPATGNWQISPNELAVTIDSMQLMGPGRNESVDFEDCVVTFDLAQPGLAQQLDCAFSVPAGTYTSTFTNFSPTYTLLIDDPANGIYTDPTNAALVTSSMPAGGAAPVTVTATGTIGGGGLRFHPPLDVADGDALEISIVLDALHSLIVHSSGGTLALGADGNGNPGFPGSASALGVPAAVAYYVNDVLGTPLSYNASTLGMQTYTAVALLYGQNVQPSFLAMRGNGAVTGCPSQTGFFFPGAGNGYLGMTDDGVVGWAGMGASGDYTALMSLQTVDPGDPTELVCEESTTDPAPPGGSFQEAPPNITAPTLQVPMTLLAQ